MVSREDVVDEFVGCGLCGLGGSVGGGAVWEEVRGEGGGSGGRSRFRSRWTRPLSP